MFFLRIGLVLGLMTVLPALAVYYGCLHGKSGRRLWKWLLGAVTLLQLAGMVCFVVFAFAHGGSASAWWRLLLHACIGVAGAEAAAGVCALLAGSVFRKKKYVRLPVLWLGAVLALLNIVMVAMAFIIGNKRIDVTEFTYGSKDLPEAFDGFRVVHISDLHLGIYGHDTTRVAELIDKVLAQKGDMIVFTGDLVNFESKEALPFVDQLSRLKAPYGVYAILGNHDYGVYRNFATKEEQVADIAKLVAMEQRCGWQVLRNEHAIVSKDGDSIVVVGVENDGNPPFPKLADIPKALKGIPDSAHGGSPFEIMLTHDPSHWRRNVLGESSAQLTLAGHTHGMQFRLGKWSPAALVYREWGGQYYEGDRSLVVSVGLGLGAVPFRFGAWSEVCVITLKSLKSSK